MVCIWFLITYLAIFSTADSYVEKLDLGAVEKSNERTPSANSDNGFKKNLNEGKRSGTCKTYKTEGATTWFSNHATAMEFCGPHFSNIIYMKAAPAKGSKEAYVKVLWGGLNHHFVILLFEASNINQSFVFDVEVCWDD